MPNTYPPPHIPPSAFEKREVDPWFWAAKTLAMAIGNSAYHDFASFMASAEVNSLLPNAASIEEPPQQPRHPGILAAEQQGKTHSQGCKGKGIFSDKQRSIVREFGAEKPLSVVERLQIHDPSMTQTYKQVKGAVDWEKRKSSNGNGKNAMVSKDRAWEEQAREDNAEQE